MIRPGLAAMLAALTVAGCQATPKPPLEAVAPIALHPLDMMTRLTLPPNVETVQQASEFLLAPAGYHLVMSCRLCPKEAPSIAGKPISPLALQPQLTSIRRGLVLIAGSNTRLVVDDSAHEVTFAYLPGEGQ